MGPRGHLAAVAGTRPAIAGTRKDTHFHILATCRAFVVRGPADGNHQPGERLLPRLATGHSLGGRLLVHRREAGGQRLQGRAGRAVPRQPVQGSHRRGVRQDRHALSGIAVGHLLLPETLHAASGGRRRLPVLCRQEHRLRQAAQCVDEQTGM